MLYGQIVVAQLSEVGVITGVTYYVGDLNNKHFKNSAFSMGILYRYNINDRIAFRINFLYGNVKGKDSQSDDPVKVNRNLSFKSSIAELGGIFEFSYYTYSPGDKKNKFSTYILMGFNYFKMNPKGLLDDVWYELNALGTEGQNFEGGPKHYKLDAFAIPIGLGAKVNLGKRIAIAIEYSIRFTFTDYLDDVSGNYWATDDFLNSNGELTIAGQLADRRLDPGLPTQNEAGETLGLQRGNPSRKDWYGFAGILLSFRIGKDNNTCATWN
jgi:hypothetical protein